MSVTTPWRLQRVSSNVAMSFLMTFGREQAPLPTVIPAALVEHAAFLQRQQWPGYGQQAVATPRVPVAQQAAPAVPPGQAGAQAGQGPALAVPPPPA